MEMVVRRPVTTNEARDSGFGLFGLILAVVAVLGVLWFVFSGDTEPTTTATVPGTGNQVESPATGRQVEPDTANKVERSPPATTPTTPSAPK